MQLSTTRIIECAMKGIDKQSVRGYRAYNTLYGAWLYLLLQGVEDDLAKRHGGITQ